MSHLLTLLLCRLVHLCRTMIIDLSIILDLALWTQHCKHNGCLFSLLAYWFYPRKQRWGTGIDSRHSLSCTTQSIAYNSNSDSLAIGVLQKRTSTVTCCLRDIAKCQSGFIRICLSINQSINQPMVPTLTSVPFAVVVGADEILITQVLSLDLLQFRREYVGALFGVG